jgi:ABC-type amino acid transport system permease subunit
MLYPRPIPEREVTGAVTAFVIGIAVGYGMYWALGSLEQRGRLVKLVIRWLSWYVAIASGMTVLVGIAGPYVFAGPIRFGGYDDQPITRSELIWTPAIMALAYTLISMWQGRNR